MKNPRFIESGRTAGNRLPSPGKVKKAVSKPATDLENRSPPFRVKKGAPLSPFQETLSATHDFVVLEQGLSLL